MTQQVKNSECSVMLGREGFPRENPFGQGTSTTLPVYLVVDIRQGIGCMTPYILHKVYTYYQHTLLGHMAGQNWCKKQYCARVDWSEIKYYLENQVLLSLGNRCALYQHCTVVLI